MFKKFLTFLAFLLICSSATASIHISCDCGQESCVCFIQLGDEGKFVSSVIKLLKEQGYCDKKQKVAVFDEGVLKGVLRFQKEHGLPQTGMLDDDTLTLIIFGLSPEGLDKAHPLSRADYNWIPTDGGIRRHRKPSCCDMYDPRKVSIRNAEALGYGPCGHCNQSDLPII